MTLKDTIVWFAFAAALILLAMATAHAQTHLPPVEYDKPYTGKLTIERVTPEQLRAQCSNATFSSLGCAFPSGTSCRILLVDDASMRADGRGWTYELMLRHERAHCNGWPQAHPGMRPVR